MAKSLLLATQRCPRRAATPGGGPSSTATRSLILPQLLLLGLFLAGPCQLLSVADARLSGVAALSPEDIPHLHALEENGNTPSSSSSGTLMDTATFDDGGAIEDNERMAYEVSLLRGGGGGGGGGDRRLQQVPTQGPVAATFEALTWSAPLIAVTLTHVPAVGARGRKYFAYWRAANATMDKSAATFDLDNRQVKLLPTRFDQFCNGPIVLADGNPAIFGGYDVGNNVQKDGRKLISVYNDAKKTLFNVGNMSFSRWYPTPCITADNKVLIVGGTPFGDKGPKVPVAELWDPAMPRRTVPVPMPPTFAAASWFNWYPFIVLLPGGEILWWGDRGGSITDQDWKEIYTFPPLPPSFPFRTMYWFTSSIVLNALKPDGNGEYNAWSMTIFGGAPANVMDTTPAANVSARLDMFYCGAARICDRGWVIEDMAGQRRVMPTTTVLPNGKVYIHGGGQAGFAGWKKGRNGYKSILPAHRDLVYDPDAPLGSRYSLSDIVNIIHMYHASSCLDLSGKVLSTGCETCGMTGAKANLPRSVSRSPDGDLDYRLSFAVPTEIGASVARPVIVTAPKVIERGSIFNVTYRYGGPVTGATLAAPCANTHSINMNQRVLFLNVESAAGGVAIIRAPPLAQPAAAHPGYYQLFLLGANTATGRTYSEGIWVNLTN